MRSSSAGSSAKTASAGARYRGAGVSCTPGISPRGLMPGVPLTPAPRNRAPALAVFALEPAEEDRMLEALRAYDTQMRTLAPFLLAFVRSTELFASLPGVELAPP